MKKSELRQIIQEEVKLLLKESYYSFLGGNSNFTDEEMRRNVVDKVLGKNYVTYIQFKDPEYNTMKTKYAKDVTNWKEIWRSQSYQSSASLSPNGKVIFALIFDNGGIVGAFYVKK